MKFKKIASLLICAFMAFAVTSCGGGSTSTTPKDETTKTTDGGSATKPTSDKKLSVAIWDTYQKPGIETMLSEFTAQTGIKTEVQVVKWEEYWTMLEAGAQGGSLPDVFWMHSNESQRYMSNGLLLDLTDKIKGSETINLDKFPKDIVGIYTYDNKNYAIPKDVDTIALWYNKKMFDEAGIAYPDDTWTWDTLRDNAKKLTKPDGSQYGFALNSNGNQEGYYNIIYDMGGYVISDDKKKSGYDDPNTIKAMNLVEGIIKDGSMPKAEVMAETGKDVLLTSGKTAMLIDGSWMLAAYANNDYTKENVDVAVLPKDATTGKRVSIYNGLGWAANADGPNTEEAWKLLEYLGSEKAQLRQAELGITMSAYENTSEAWVNSVKFFNLQAYLDMTKDMVIRPYSKNTVVWENMSIAEFVKAWSGQVTMEDACKTIATKMNEILAEE